MPRGTPLTTEQIAQLSAAYTLSRNVASAARQVGVSYAAAWEAIHGARDDSRRYLHAHALAVGEGLARRSVVQNIRRLEQMLAAHVDEPLESRRPPELEPADIATLVRAQATNLSTLARVRIAVSKELGRHAPEVVEVRTSPRDEVARRINELAERAAESGAPGESQ